MSDFGNTIVAVIIVTAIISFIGWIGYEVGTAAKPTAMDVYQGKTTLEITYKDGIPVDSTVVWKSESLKRNYNE